MTLLLGTSGDRAAQAFSVLQQVAAIGSVYSLSYMTAGRYAAALCTLGYASVPALIYFSGCGYVEPALLMTFGISLVGLVCLLKLNDVSPIARRANLQITAYLGFLAGLMPALKYNGLIYLGLIGLIMLWARRKGSVREAVTASTVFVIAAASGFCWMVWNWGALGNPVYPMAWFLFGGNGWDDVRAVSMSLFLDNFGMGRDISDYLLFPWRLAFSGRFDSTIFDGPVEPALPIFLVLAVLTVIPFIRRRQGSNITKGLGVPLLASASFFVFGTQQSRFWLPAHVLLCGYGCPPRWHSY